MLWVQNYKKITNFVTITQKSMKKILFLSALAMVSMYALAANEYTLEEIRDQWQTRNIKVAGASAQPGIIQLLTAFQNVWGAYVIDPVLQKAKDPKFTKWEDDEYGGGITVDRKNGYVCLDSGGGDGGFMEACVWRRDNGHRLLALVLGQPVDPEIEFVCFYDYDPKTSTLYPEKWAEEEFQPLDRSHHVSYNLPQKGKDFIVSEYDIDLQTSINHVFTWDGNKHHFSHLSINELKYGYRWFSSKETQYLTELTHIALVTLPGQTETFYVLGDDDKEEGMVAIACYKGNIELVGINDDITGHKLSFYPNVIVTHAEINDYTSYAFLKDGGVDVMITEYPTLGANGQPKITIDGWDNLTEEEARQKIKSLGQPVQIKPQWRKVKIWTQNDL